MVQYDASEEILQEREAMTAIARALRTLEHTAARQRVMRWAAEKFQLTLPASAPFLASVGAPVAARPEALEDQVPDIFEKQVRGKEPLDALVRELAADFQRLALEWHGA